MWLDTGGSNVNKVGWLECEGAEDFRSRSRCWLELNSAGEERGPWLAEERFLRESVKRRKGFVSEKSRENVLVLKTVVREREKSIWIRDSNMAATFSPSDTHYLCLPREAGWALWPSWLNGRWVTPLKSLGEVWRPGYNLDLICSTQGVCLSNPRVTLRVTRLDSGWVSTMLPSCRWLLLGADEDWSECILLTCPWPCQEPQWLWPMSLPWVRLRGMARPSSGLGNSV